MNELLASDDLLLDKDLLVLDEVADTISIPVRDWSSIILAFEGSEDNERFPIPATVCSRIIEELKVGAIPQYIFKQYGISFQAFNTKYGKIKKVLEQISEKHDVTKEEKAMVRFCRNHPIFLLGSDIERCVAFNFNDSIRKLRGLSDSNAMYYKEYMKLIHPSFMQEDSKGSDVNITVKIGEGIWEKL